MNCPQCNKKMIRQSDDMIYASNPPQWDERWWCGCGYVGAWERVGGETGNQTLKDRWQKENDSSR